jgi:hypothetical protein
MLASRMRPADLIEALFEPEHEARAPWLVNAFLAMLFVAGLAGWSYVMGWGVARLDFHDWTGINLPRLTFLQNALTAGEAPLHMTGTASLHKVTDRFLALPDVITSPQTLLLLVLPVTTFILVDVWLQFTLGFVGIVMLRRHFTWSLAALAAVYLLFLFNGHILSHYSVGHFTWGAYFMLPWVAWFVFRFLDGDTSMRLLAWLAVTMCYMVLAGGHHHMSWVVLLLTLLIPFCWQRAWWLVAAIAASGLLSAVRLLPPAMELQSFRKAGLVADIIGFPSVSHMLTSLAVLRREHPAFNEALPGNIWFFDSAFYEFNAYIGVLGVGVLIVGLYWWLRDRAARYQALVFPLFIMVALSIGSAYRLVRATAIPLLEGERYTSRLFILPLLFLIVMAVTAIDQRLRHAALAAWQRALVLLGLVVMAIDTAASMRLWRVAVSSGLFGPAPFNPADALVAHRADPAYVRMALAGVAISALTALVLAVLAARERYRPVTRSHSA